MPSSTDWEEGLTDRDMDLQNLIKAQQLIKLIKWLAFQIYFTKYLKETLRHILKRLWSFSFDLNVVVPSRLKVTTRNYSHTIKTSRSEVAATRSTTIDDLNLWVEISKSQTREFVCNKFIIEKTVNLELACGHMSKYYKR